MIALLKPKCWREANTCNMMDGTIFVSSSSLAAYSLAVCWMRLPAKNPQQRRSCSKKTRVLHEAAKNPQQR